jgi:hypothetical protein
MVMAGCSDEGCHIFFDGVRNQTIVNLEEKG